MSTPGILKSKISLSDARKAASSTNSSSLKSRASGLKSVSKSSVFTYTRAIGNNTSVKSTGGWVSAQRSFNPYDNESNKVNKYAKMRAQANRYAGVYNMRYMGRPGGVTATDDCAAKTALWFQLGTMAANSIFGMLNQLGVFGDTDNLSKQGPGSDDGKLPTATTLSGKLSSANSFSSIKQLEQQAEYKKANLDSSYKRLDITSSVDYALNAAGVQEGLKSAGVTLNTDSLSLSDLESDDLEKAIETIDSDHNKVTNFKENNLDDAKNAVSSKSGQVKDGIKSIEISIQQFPEMSDLVTQKAAIAADGGDTSAIDQQIEQLKELQQKLADLKKQQANLEAASKALGDIETQCDGLLSNLEAKKSEVQDLKEFEDNLKDKKYNLAKSQDEQLKNTMDSIDKLTKQIDALTDKDSNKATKSNQKRSAKYNALIQERAGLYKTLGTLTKSLSAAGEKKFVDSNNRTYELKYLDKAMAYGSASTVEQLSSGGNEGASALDKVNNAKAGETIELGNATYTVQSDGTFKSDEGNMFTKDQMLRIVNSDIKF